MNPEKLQFLRTLYNPEKKQEEKYQITEEDIQLILKQVITTRDDVINKLNENNGNLVETIIQLFN